MCRMLDFVLLHRSTVGPSTLYAMLVPSSTPLARVPEGGLKQRSAGEY